MGMAASQARLLSITARLTNNENSGQSVSYSKQRLADQTQQITNEYNEALSATKLTVLTSFNGADANYTDISYNLMTSPQMAENVKQYVVTDTKGRVLVTKNLADAYQKSNGNYNQFLANIGYSQADITVQKNSSDEQAKQQTEQQIHEAWDAYFATIGVNLGDNEHDFGFSWTETIDQNGNYAIGQGYAGYLRTDENGNPVTNTGELAYKTDASGNFVDKDGNIVAKDAYTDESLYTEDNGYSKVYYGLNNELLDKDAYADESSYTKDNGYSKKYYDINGKEIPYDLDTDNDGTPDAYSDDVINNSNYTYKYSDASGKEVPYDKYSDSITTNDAFTYKYADSNGNIIEYDSYSQASYDKMVTDSSKVVYDPINYEGTTDEQRQLFDYAMAITEAYLRVNEGANKDYNTVYDMSLLESASDSENASIIKYYQNIFTKMQSSGYFTYTDTLADATNDPEHYIYASIATGTAGNVQKSPLKDNTVFEAALRDGTLRLEYYSSTDKAFKSTTISEDTCIQEVADEKAIAKAESKYNQDMADLENKDKKYDLELKKLDTEHSALQTEYDSIKNVVDKNVENSFKTFG